MASGERGMLSRVAVPERSKALSHLELVGVEPDALVIRELLIVTMVGEVKHDFIYLLSQ